MVKLEWMLPPRKGTLHGVEWGGGSWGNQDAQGTVGYACDLNRGARTEAGTDIMSRDEQDVVSWCWL